jgi:hypothetical protein
MLSHSGSYVGLALGRRLSLLLQARDRTACEHSLWEYEMTDFHCRELREDEIDDLYATHSAVIENLPSRELFRDVDKEYFRALLGPAAITYGLFAGSRMIGYSALKLPSPGDQSHATHIGFSGPALSLVGEFDGSAVLPEYRGMRLQNILIEVKARASVLRGRPLTVATISPNNYYSMINALQYGMTGRASLMLYDNYPRVIVARDHTARATPEWHSVQQCKFGDTDHLALLFAEGYELYDISAYNGQKLYILGRRSLCANAGILKPLSDCAVLKS